MSSKQDAPARRKSKARATKKLDRLRAAKEQAPAPEQAADTQKEESSEA